MIPKQNRLSENEVKKVLRVRKPFFSYGFVANVLPNRLGYNRFWVIFSGKHTRTSITRNFFRRRLYDLVAELCLEGSNDVVFVPKKGKVFDHKNPDIVREFDKDILFLKKFIK